MQVAANTRGVALLQGLVSEYGLDVISAYMGHIQARDLDNIRDLSEALSTSTAPLLLVGLMPLLIICVEPVQPRTHQEVVSMALCPACPRWPLSACRCLGTINVLLESWKKQPTSPSVLSSIRWSCRTVLASLPFSFSI